MADFAEQLPTTDSLTSPSTKPFFKNSIPNHPTQTPSYANNQSLPNDLDNDNVGSDSDEENLDDNDNDFNSPLQQFLQANAPSIKDFTDAKFYEISGGVPSSSSKTPKYSMDADMIFGWKPKYVPQCPVPLRFFSPMVENIVNCVYKSESQSFPELVYQGFRPENTLFMHEKYSSPETYNIKFSPFLIAKHELFCKLTANNSINPKRPFIGMKEGVKNDCLVFDSIFEHGNLDTAIRRATNEYDLYIRVDSNTKGHTSWFYFTIRNMKKGQKVQFNIMNLSKSKSLYQRGMKPYVFSQKSCQNEKATWQQCGDNVSYERASISYNSESFSEPNNKKYYKLSFEYTFKHDNDVVSFALCPPYTYTQLLQFVQTLIDDQRNKNEGTYLTTSKLCYSLSGVNTPLLTITDPDEPEFPLAKRQYVVCTGRVHPGETNSSWMIQGFVNELCKSTKEAKYLRKRFVFKVVPMLNPDGVIVGNHRTGMCGTDLNRQFVTPKDILHQNLVALKEVVKEIVGDKKDVFAYIDFHGHSQKKNVFMYGAEFPVYDPNYYRVKMLPKLLSKRTDMFRFQSCLFTISRPKMTTARAVFSIQYGITHFYTLEASYSNFVNTERETIAFDAKKFIEMGVAVTEGLGDYRKLLDEEEKVTKSFKMKQGELLKLNLAKSENGAFGEKTSSRQRPGFTEDKLSSKPITECPTPKTSDREKKKNNKFRIRKGKAIDLEGNNVNNNVENESNRNNNENSFEALKKSAKKNNNFDEESTRDQEKTERRESSVENTVNLGIFSLIEELKVDLINKEVDRNESDDYSEGGSDSEDSEDDFSSEEMRKMQKNIVGAVDKFRDICKNEEKYEAAAQKPKVKKLKKSSSSNVKTPLPKEKSKSKVTLPLKTSDQTPRKPPNLIDSPALRQTLRNIQTATDKNSTRSLTTTTQKAGDNSARTLQFQPPQKQKPSLFPKEIQIDSDSSNAIAQIKNQLSSFYMGSLTGPRKEGSLQRLITSAHASRQKEQKLADDNPENKKMLDNVKLIYMNPHMDRHYQIPQKELKFPIDYYSNNSNNKVPSVNSYPKENEPMTEENDMAFNLHLDKGYNKAIINKVKVEKDLCSIDQELEQNKTREEVKDTKNSPYRLFIPKTHTNHSSHSAEQQQARQTLDGEEQPTEKSATRGRKFGGGGAHITVATSVFYTGNKGDMAVGITPLKKDRKLPISFETYKKMMSLRKKPEDINLRKSSAK